MKKRTITVHLLETPLTPGTEYLLPSYPHDGFFQLPDGRVYLKSGTFVSIMPFPGGFDLFDKQESIEAVVSETPSAIDMNNFLKALAIAQKPELAVELCK